MNYFGIAATVAAVIALIAAELWSVEAKSLKSQLTKALERIEELDKENKLLKMQIKR